MQAGYHDHDSSGWRVEDRLTGREITGRELHGLGRGGGGGAAGTHQTAEKIRDSKWAEEMAKHT